MDPDVRFAVAKLIVERALDHGIPREDIVVDPLLMPIGAMPTAGRQVFRDPGPAARRAEGQLDLRRVERELRVAAPRGHQRRLPRDGDGERPHLGDHEPDRGRVSARASWRPTCCSATTATPPAGSGPTASRRPTARPAAGGRTGRTSRRGGGRLADRGCSRREPLVIFTPSGRRGRFATGTTVLDAARALGVDIDSVCGGRGICGRCQVEQSVGSFPKHGIESKAGNLSPLGPRRGGLPEQEGPRCGPSPQLHGPRPRRRRRRRPAREPGLPPGRAQGPRAARAERRPGRSASTTSR